MYSKNRDSISRITIMAILCAATVVLQTLGAMFPLKVAGISISLVLIPITVSAYFFGIRGGLIIGTAFGLTVFVHSIIGLDAAGATIFAMNPIFTFLITTVRGALAGLLAGIVADATIKINHSFLRALIIGICAPIFNTSIFLLFYATLFNDLLVEGAATYGFGNNIFSFVIIGLVGINFIFELLTTALLAPPVCKAMEKVNK